MHNAEAALIQSLMMITSNSERTVVSTKTLMLTMMSFGIRCSTGSDKNEGVRHGNVGVKLVVQTVVMMMIT